MGTMQQALANLLSTPPQQNQRKATASSPATKRSGMDVVKALREAQARRQTAKTSATATEAAAAQQREAIEQVAELLYADEVLTAELSELNRQKNRHPRGSVQAEEARNLVDQHTENQSVVRQDLAEIRKANPSAYTEGARQYNFRQEALEMAETNRQLIGSVTGADIRSRITGAKDAGFIVVSGDGELKFDRQSYASAWPNDLSVSDVAASLKELIDDLRERHDEDDQKVVAELVRGGFYISARRDPDGKGGQLPSELDLLRDEPGTVRKASEFLVGNGQRYIARMGGPRDFVVLEHRGDKFLAVKATSAKAGRAMFTVPDRATGARVARKSTSEINNSGTTVTATDLSGVWYDPLRLALEEDIRREAESAERREAANELRDISSVENPLTLSDIATGGTGTAPVSIQYESPENQRRHTVTFRVTGNGTTFSITGTVPGTEETIKRVKRSPKTREILSSKPFLPEFIGKETPLGVLEKDPLWRLVRDLNRHYERDWRLAVEAERHNAVSVTRDNLDGLIGLEGQNGGTFAVRATLRKNLAERGQEPRYVYNPVGYIVERNGSKVKIAWAVPGTSANYAEGMIGNEYEVADLPNRLRFVLGNVLWTFTKENGGRPTHLRPAAKRQDAATADTEE